MAKVGDVFLLIRNGASIKQTEGASGLPITRIETISSRVVDRNKMGYADVVDNGEYDDYILQDGDILMSHINSEKHLGKTAIYENLDSEKIIHGMNLLVLRCDERLIPKYAYYFFNSNRFIHQIPNITKKSVNQASFNVSALKQLYIPVPDKEVQKDIISVLDKVDNLCDCYNKQLNDLELLIKSRFIEMFGDLKLNDKKWEVKFFKDLTLLITDGEHSTPRRTDNGIYLLSARNVLNHSLQLNDIDYIDEVEYERISKRIQPMIGDVLLSCSGSVGRCCAITKDIKFQMVRSVALLRFKAEINPVFAEYMIVSDYLQEQINSNKTASSQSNLFQGKIKMLKGVIPPLDLQNQFADFVEEVNKSKFTHCYELLLLIIKKIWYNNYV